MHLRGRKQQEGGEHCIAEFRYLCPSPNQIKSRGMRWVGHVAHMEVKRTACEILLGKAEGQTRVGRPR